MKSTCKLCHQHTELRESHFIPKFVGKWLKSTSATGYLRDIKSINKRQQDIFKAYWLCSTCENLFSGWEKQFADNIFYTFLNENKYTLEYDEWMSKFCTSLSWRTLTYMQSQISIAEESPEFTASLKKAEEHLRNYLLKENHNLHQYEQHIFPLTEIENASKGLNLPANINRFFLRSIGLDILTGGQDIYIYTKLPTFLILGIIKSEFSAKMRVSRISLKKGILRPSALVMPEYLLGYMKNKAIEITESIQGISTEQRDKINQHAMKNIEKTLKSKSFEAIMHDYRVSKSGDSFE